MTNKQSDSTAAEQFLKSKSELMKRDWHKSIYVNPNTLAETMTEFAALESAKEAQLFDQWKLDNGWKSTNVYIKKYYKRMGKNLIRADFNQLWKEYQLYKEGKG